MKIAIIGAGISGLTSAYLLSRGHDITLFEAAPVIGGHTNTVAVERPHATLRIDTGFIVYNERTYPNFIKLMARLGVESIPTEMSFSVRCDRTGLEYNGANLNTLFAQRSNIFRPSFHRMLLQILRFNKAAVRDAPAADASLTLGEYLDRHGYSRRFAEHYIGPMVSAIWSCPPSKVRQFPFAFFVRFFDHHGMLTVNDRPQWRVIAGGSFRYLDPLIATFRDRIRVACPVRSIRRAREHVEVSGETFGTERFDHVVLATHSDQSLAMLSDPTPAEREILADLPYQPNEAVLHTDRRFLPRRPLAWAAWNYHIPREQTDAVALTYSMNILQRLPPQPNDEQFLVTLNQTASIREELIIQRVMYHHPVYTARGIAAQSRHAEISGVARTHYCGAYWFNGFHEDGVRSALRVAERFGASL